MATEIKRVIFLSDIESLDVNNFGGHFTANLNYIHNAGGSNGLTDAEAEFKVSFFCKKYVVNETATEISNENHPKEKEVVLCADQKLKGELSIMRRNEKGGYDFVSFEKSVVNTGTRFDGWV